jgi:quercetin dioxygenase-like cupin family protein
MGKLRARRSSIRCRTALALAVPMTVALAAGPAGAQEAGRVVRLQDIEWGPPGTTPRFPQGVRTSQVRVDPATEGPTYFARFPGGSHFDTHWHSHAEYAVVLAGAGTIVLGEETQGLSRGSYVVIPARLHHSWDVPAGGEDLVILVRRDGPADFNFVDP